VVARPARRVVCFPDRRLRHRRETTDQPAEATGRIGKVLVVGAGEAGKSTVIELLSNSAMNLQVGGRTVAMDHATLSRDGQRMSLVGVPGQHRFAPVREVLSAGARAALWVHRVGAATDPSTAELVRHLIGWGATYAVLENDDDEGAERPGWVNPPGLPPPFERFRCNVLASPGARDRVARVLWDLSGTWMNRSREERT